MAYPVAANYPQLSGSYIPTLYAMQLLVVFYQATCLSEIANTKHEAAIKSQGDTVRIRTLPDIGIRTHSAGQIHLPQALNPSYVDLLIDKGRAWDFMIDSITQLQTDLKDFSGQWMQHAMKRLKINVETEVLAYIPGQASAYNTGITAGKKSGNLVLGTDGAPVALTSDLVVKKIGNVARALDEQDIDRDENRWGIIPAWMADLIMNQSDIKNASITGMDKSPMLNGQLPVKIGGFKLFQSNLLPVSVSANTPTTAIFGHKEGVTFASQMLESKVTDNPFGFGNIFKGLQVFGRKVTNPECVANLICYEG